MAEAGPVDRAKDLVEGLARGPRFSGSEGEAAARAICVEELKRAGLECTERRFEYSEWPGKWGIPVAAAVQVATILTVAGTAVGHGPLLALVLGGALYVALFLASSDARRRWTQAFPFIRSESVNLEARRGDPKVWLVAHLDSKSQMVPMLVRIASSIALTVATVIAAVALLISLAHPVEARGFWRVMEFAAVLVGLPSMFCFVRDDSPGAVDNASGVVSVLLAAQMIPPSLDIGVLITSAEELALAGARVWSAGAKPGLIVLNCDTIDDAGGWRLMYTSSRPRRIEKAARAVSASRNCELPIRRLIPGILADSVAFADRGIESITLSRGTLSTLARVHTRRDTSNVLAAGGVSEAGTLLAALTRELI
ncbi:MAG: M28 family peptidase [Gemmatimonadaceae bacterium]